jgi:hypothetical protein
VNNTATTKTAPTGTPREPRIQNSAASPMVEPDVLARVLAEASKTGGDFAEVFAEDRVNSSAVLDDGRVEELTSGH